MSILRLARRGLLVGVPVAATVAVLVAPQAASAHRPMARATLKLADGTAVGRVLFFNDRDDTQTRVVVSVHVPAGTTAVRAFHGFHIHANDNPANGVGCIADPHQPPATWFVSADGHLKSDDQVHGAHDGDMPSLLLNRDGTAKATFTTDRFEAAQLAGRAVILHAGSDNFGNVPVGGAADQYTASSPAAVTKTQATGNAGDRVACGVVTTR